MQEKDRKKILLKKRQQTRRLKQQHKKSEFLSSLKAKISSVNWKAVIPPAILVLAHIAILLVVLWSWRYYSISPALFGSVVAIILCLMCIIDIIFFVGFNHHDMALKIVSMVMAVLLLIGGTVGSVMLSKANTIVNNVLDDGKSEKYETFSGVFVYYDQNEKHYSFTSLKDLNGKKIGMLLESSNGLTYIANQLLSKEKVDYAQVDYKTNAELMTALIDGDVDAIVITSAYRSIYKGVEDTPSSGEEEVVDEEPIIEEETTDTASTGEEGTETQGDDSTETTDTMVSTVEESPFTKYLPNLVDFYSFEQELKIDTNKKTKNISQEPFNVLLIGYSRTDIGSPVGLADSIILATINPQTYEVSMTSIARDSFVPIACYGGEYDKINSGRSTSRACFIETVENFIGMDIDYYMELDYLGLVQIVNVIGGITINNPVEFTLDGIYVPAGENVFADGQMALQFCRERHHMPNGDFDRQQHQKEVIIEIAKAFVKSGSVTLPLKAMEEASEWMSTDMTLGQLTSMFNLLLNTKNFTSLDTFNLVDFQNTRITGYGGILYYSMSMRLPLWVYLIYQGSYDESMEHVNNVMGNYKTITQQKNLTFSLDNEYVRPELISTDYEKKFLYEPDPMPPYWANLEGMTTSDALAWAKANGVSLSVVTIKSGDAGYDSSYEGLVYSQSPRYGNLISDYRSGTITVMGSAKIDENKQVPDFVGHNYSKAESWAKDHGISFKAEFRSDVDGKAGDVVSQTPEPGTAIDKVDKLKVVVKEGSRTITLKPGSGFGSDQTITVKSGETKSFPWLNDVTKDSKTYKFQGWFTSSGTYVSNSDGVSGDATLYGHWLESGSTPTTTKVTYKFIVGDEVVSSGTIDSGATPPTPSNPTPDEGYKFTGWSPSVGPITANTEYKATFEKIQPSGVTCWDGSTASSEEACPVKCWDGSAADDEDSCPAKPVTCWDGSTAEDEDSCPSYVTCWDGSKAYDDNSCPAYVECWDGSKAYSEEYCPVQE